MKKLLIGFAFFGLFAIAIPAKANETVQPSCSSMSVRCLNGTNFMATVCSQEDVDFFVCYYCDHC
ncbi:MAG: hypothetical protein Q7U54_19630 [Bacteroidales bacterium]|nr:hypothetical protein [Bacteroidales bacterium]